MMNAVDEEEAVMNKPIAPHLEKHKTGAGNYVKSIIYGGSDGIVSVFVTVAAVSGSNFGIGLVLVLGLAKLFAGALSMGVGDWLATDAEVDMASKERQREEWECENYLEGEVEEMVELYVKKGLDENTAREIMNILSKNKKVFVDIMMAEELGISPDIVDESPWKHGLVNFVSFMIFGSIPLLAYALNIGLRHVFNYDTSYVFYASIGITALSLFGLGMVKAHLTGSSWWKSGLQTLLFGSFTAFVGWFVGFILDYFFPGVNVE